MSDKTETLPATQPKREIRVVQDDGALSYLFDTARFEHIHRIAAAMGRASLIPKHIKGDTVEQTVANCFLVVNQSIRWGLDPFSVLPETYEVGGKLGYQGKLIGAVVNTRAGLKDRLNFKFNDKTGDALEITVSGTFDGEDVPRTVQMTVAQGRTQNQMWTKDPHQKLIYSATIKWARRHCPEVILGVVTDDDLERIAEEHKFAASRPVHQIPTTEQMMDSASGTDTVPTKTIVVVPDPKPQPKTEVVDVASKAVATEPTAPVTTATQSGTDEELPNLDEPAQEIQKLMKRDVVTEAQVLAYCLKMKLARPGQELPQLATHKLKALVTNWKNILPEIKK